MKQNIFDRFSFGGMLLGLSLAAGLIISAAQFTRAWLHIADSQVISVTGSAHEDITSDDAVWTASFVDEADQLVEAQRKLKVDAGRVDQFFKDRGITNFEISAINIQRLRRDSESSDGTDDTKKTTAYRLKQTLKLESRNVQQVMDMQQQSSGLVEAGVELDDGGIQFIYTKTAEAKIEMLAAAAKDARARAEQIAGQGGRKIRAMRSARMGVFQITPRNSGESSSEGLNDSTSRDKTIHAVVEANFSLE